MCWTNFCIEAWCHLERIGYRTVFFSVAESAPKYEYVTILWPLNRNDCPISWFGQPLKNPLLSGGGIMAVFSGCPSQERSHHRNIFQFWCRLRHWKAIGVVDASSLWNIAVRPAHTYWQCFISGCPNQEIGWPFQFIGHIIGTYSYLGADSATKNHCL